MIQLTNEQLGAVLGYWHESQEDYIYGVGSLLRSNRLDLLTPNAVRGAIRNLRLDVLKPCCPDVEQCEQLADELARRFAYLLVEVVT